MIPGMDAITVVGAGGIGCAVGHALAAAGVAVTFVDADPAKVAWGRANGVCVEVRAVIDSAHDRKRVCCYFAFA